MSVPVVFQQSFNNNESYAHLLLVVAYDCRFLPQSCNTRLVCRPQKIQGNLWFMSCMCGSHESCSEQWWKSEMWQINIWLLCLTVHEKSALWCICSSFWQRSTDEGKGLMFSQLCVSSTYYRRVLITLGSVRDKCNRNLTWVYMLLLNCGHLGQKTDNQQVFSYVRKHFIFFSRLVLQNTCLFVVFSWQGQNFLGS